MIDQFWTWLYTNLTSEMGGGLAVAGIVSVLLMQAKMLPKHLWDFLCRRLTCVITIDNDQPGFFWTDKWFHLNRHKIGSSIVRLDNDYRIPSNEISWFSGMGYGLHFMWYKGRPVLIRRFRHENQVTTDMRHKETIEFRVVLGGHSVIQAFLKEVHELRNEKNVLKVHTHDGDWWRAPLRRPFRLMSSIFMDKTIKTKLLRDVSWFLNAKSWYEKRGIPYRRGYLFQGDPGTGKSSFVSAIASEFNLPIYILNLSCIRQDSTLSTMVGLLEPRSILLIEDIDSFAVSQERSQDTSSSPTGDSSKITLSGLLNVLDGIAAAENIILIMTTNHPRVLDRALVRPGRVDMEVEFKALESETIEQMFRVFYPDLDIDSKEFQEMEPQNPAKLQGIFLEHNTDGLAALEKLKKSLDIQSGIS